MSKLAKTFHGKALGAGKVPEEGQLDKINRYALTPLTAEQVHVRRYLMAHNGIDRDVERFSEGLLDDFARTLPGKGVFVEGHPSSYGGKGGPGRGRYFDASCEEMQPEKFLELTGESIKLPPDVGMVKVLWGDAYMLRLDSNSDTLANIDGGIYGFSSIGFRAPYFEVTDERGNVIYGEYRPKGEALEGSLVWLGAQPGAGAVKGAKAEKTKEETPVMKEFLKLLGEKLGKTFSEEKAADEIAAIVAGKDAEIDGLKAAAADGTAYRKHLVEGIAKYGTLVGEIPTDEAGQKAELEFVATWPIDRVKAYCDIIYAPPRQQFPDKFTVQSKDQSSREERDKKAAENQQSATGKKKDYTDPQQNELLQDGK